MKIRSAEKPEMVAVLRNFDGTMIARFADEIEEVEIPDQEDENKTVKIYEFKIVDFKTKWSESLKNRILKNPEYFLAKIKKING